MCVTYYLDQIYDSLSEYVKSTLPFNGKPYNFSKIFTMLQTLKEVSLDHPSSPPFFPYKFLFILTGTQLVVTSTTTYELPSNMIWDIKIFNRCSFVNL